LEKVIIFEDFMQKDVISFFTNILPEYGRVFDPDHAHRSLLNIKESYRLFLCMYDDEQLVGTIGFKHFEGDICELKAVYVSKQYQGRGLGEKLVKEAIFYAKEYGYNKMYLDTIKDTSSKAVKLYDRLGFHEIEPYHKSLLADLFMEKIL